MKTLGWCLEISLLWYETNGFNFYDESIMEDVNCGRNISD